MIKLQQFDFNQASGGDRQLAWLREVSNSTTVDNVNYQIVNPDEDMVTTYTFGIDMTQIPIPEQLEELTYMLPGADAADASAWNFLLQLAERVSTRTEVTPVIQFDANMDVDYENLKVVNEYFYLDETNPYEFDEETNTLTLHLNWKDQTAAIDPATANPICILSGIKLTPKDDAAWDGKKRLNVVNSGDISYKIYLRANALYTFAMKEENQKQFGIYPFKHEDIIINGAPESGGYFQDIYKTFADNYTLNSGLKNGWIGEEGGYAYYVDGEKTYGIEKVEGYYYNFGDNGICVGQEKYTGMLVIDGANYNCKAGVLSAGWVTVGEDSYCFDENGKGYNGTVEIDEVELVFDNGLMIGGETGFITKSNGSTYHYKDGKQTFCWYQDTDGKWYHFDDENGVMTTGTFIYPDKEAQAKNARYDFAEDGQALISYPNGYGYYYWASLPMRNQWVRNGYDPDAWYHTNENGHYVTDPTGQFTEEMTIDGEPYTTVAIAFDGVEYTFDNNSGKLLLGSLVNDNGTLYYYWAGEPVNDGWFTINGITYYAYEDGHLALGKTEIDGLTYEFIIDGTNDAQLKKGPFVAENDNLYYYWAGEPVNDGWFTVEGSRYYAYSDGHMALGRQTIDGTTYLFDETTGKLLTTGWFTVDNATYYAFENGTLAYGYQTIGEESYIFDAETGKLQTDSWITLEDDKYYAYEDGHLATGKNCIADMYYIFDAAGKLQTDNWITIEDDKHYAYEDGHLATGEQTIGDKTYIFDETGVLQGEKQEEERIETIPMHRLFNPNSGEHFYTGSVEERDTLVAAGWQYEGVAWNAPVKRGTPIYRVFNPNNGDHHYTGSMDEVNNLTALGWQYEGVAWNSASPSNLPIYRLYNPNADCGSHHYTGSEEERDYLVSLGWKYEGIGWYGMLK